MSAAPTIAGVYETILYAQDLSATAAFYRDVLGLAPLGEPSELGCAFRLASGGMLLIFDPRVSGAPGRDVPSHGATGPGHIAFWVASLEAWKAHLAISAVAIEHEATWPPGGRSIYVRDPAGNSVELVEGEVWAS